MFYYELKTFFILKNIYSLKKAVIDTKLLSDCNLTAINYLNPKDRAVPGQRALNFICHRTQDICLAWMAE